MSLKGKILLLLLLAAFVVAGLGLMISPTAGADMAGGTAHVQVADGGGGSTQGYCVGGGTDPSCGA